MILATAELYIIVFDKKDYEYQILSLHPNELILPSHGINGDLSIEQIQKILFERHTNISYDYATIYSISQNIKDNKLILSYYCIIPYEAKYKDCFPLEAKQYAYYSQDLRKLLNII